MQRIATLLQKLSDHLNQTGARTVIDVDLMLDYTRVLYADLLETRLRLTPAQPVQKPEPTLAEIAAAMELNQDEQILQPAATAPSIELQLHTEAYISAGQPEALPEEEPEAPEPMEIPAQAEPLPVFQEQQATPVFQPVLSEPADVKPPQFAPVPPKADIRSLIGINDKYQLISELFHNDKEAYEAALDALNACNNAQEAKAWVRHTSAEQYLWSESNESLQLLYYLINQFFSER